jgi:hypothetical protein
MITNNRTSKVYTRRFHIGMMAILIMTLLALLAYSGLTGNQMFACPEFVSLLIVSYGLAGGSIFAFSAFDLKNPFFAGITALCILAVLLSLLLANYDVLCFQVQSGV